MGFLWVFGVLLAVVLSIIVLVWLGERTRRWREDRWGFQKWVEFGAPHVFPELLSAFQGHVEGDVRSEIMRAGSLIVPSGGVVADDPAYLQDADPFEQRVPPGEWPVDAVILNDARVAALRLQWIDAPIAFLETAWTPAGRQYALKTRNLPAIGVDSATCVITSAEGQRGSSVSPEKDWPDLVNGPLVAEIKLPGGTNMFACISGIGDGSYPTYIGRSAAGEAVALFVDFKMLGKPQRVLKS